MPKCPRLGGFKTLLEFLCALSIHFISSHDPTDDISFHSFVKLDPLCQVLSQRDRIERWIRSVIGRDIEEADHVVESFRSLDIHHTANIHSAVLLDYFQDREESTPSFRYVVADSSVSQQELLLQQVIQGMRLRRLVCFCNSGIDRSVPY
jgi:hypothetical protein